MQLSMFSHQETSSDPTVHFRFFYALDYLGLTHLELATQLNTDPLRIEEMHRGLTAIPLSFIAALCQQFQLSQCWILTGQGPVEQEFHGLFHHIVRAAKTPATPATNPLQPKSLGQKIESIENMLAHNLVTLSTHEKIEDTAAIEEIIENFQEELFSVKQTLLLTQPLNDKKIDQLWAQASALEEGVTTQLKSLLNEIFPAPLPSTPVATPLSVVAH